jgi:hypothetical protein
MAWHWADQGTPGGNAVLDRVGVITVMDTPTAAERLYAFVRASDGHLWVNWWDGAQWHWADQGTPGGNTVSGGVGAVTVKDAPGAAPRPYAFVRASDGHLWVNWWDGAQWHWADQGTAGPSTVADGIGAITVMDTPSAAQRPYAFVRTSDEHLWVNWWNGSQWQWADQGTAGGINGILDRVGVITVMDTPRAAQRPYAFVRAIDGFLWVNWWDGSQWQWENLGFPGGPGGSTVDHGVGAITVKDTPNAAQRPYAFVGAHAQTAPGGSNSLAVNWRDGSRWQWADQGTPGPSTVAGGVGALTVMDTPNAAQRPYAFVRANDGHLWVNWWDGAQWHWADQGAPASNSVSDGVGATTVKDTPNAAQRPYAFVRANDGHLWVNYWLSE